MARDRDAVAPALNLVDDRRPEQREAALELLDGLERESVFPGPHRVGITGAPGTGKSTVIDVLVRILRARNETIGILAVDPSSQKSGGALLGDRIRVRSGAGDPGVFLRSMAARERLGGLADATWASVTILAAVFDHVFVETVGIGQSESEVVDLVDTLLFVAQPGAGDTLQFMKAGIIELPDVFAVNKGDQGAAAERTAAELAAGLHLSEALPEGWTPPVLRISARDAEGIEALNDALERHRSHLIESGTLAERRARARVTHVQAALMQRYGRYGVAAVGGPEAIADRARDARGISAFALVLALSREIEDVLRKPMGGP